MAEKVSLRRSLLFVLAGILLVGLLVVGGVWRPWHDAAMTVIVSLSTDEQGPIEVYKRTAAFASSKDTKPLTAYIEVEEWAGQLVRLDIRGVIQGRGGVEPSEGLVACSAQLVHSTGVVEPIVFVGWENDGSRGFHLGTLGSPAFIAPRKDDLSFVYGKNGSLWHVLRIPEEAVLRVTFSPLLAEDLAGEPRPAIPSLGAQRLPFRNPGSLSAENAERPPDVFIYLIDALRADHLGCYGYSRPTSPEIDAFAKTATLYEQAQTPATWTRPAVATLLTGLYAFSHRAMQDTEKLADSWELLPEILQSAGYATYAFITNAQVSGSLGFKQGYNEFILNNMASAKWANSQAERFLAKTDQQQPVFMYLHVLEPHASYAPKAETFRRFDRGFTGSCDGSSEALRAAGDLHPRLSEEDIEYLIDLYDAEIFDVDTAFGEFLELLQRTGRFENALIILLADHGEGFKEHDTIRHGHNINKEEYHVPLIIRFPQGRFAGERVGSRVSLIDILPTILAQSGVRPELKHPLPGTDLALTATTQTSGRRVLYCELSRRASNELDLAGVTDEDGYRRAIDMSVIPGKKAPKKSVGLWNLNSDPDEQIDLTESLPVRAAYHEQMIARWLVQQTYLRNQSVGATSPVEMTEELREQLRALGYLK